MKQSKVSEELEFLPQEEGFLGIKEKYLSDISKAKAVIVPFGLETAASHGAGTRSGPRAIIKASHQLEPFDEEHNSEIFKKIGIATLREPQVRIPLESALEQIEHITQNILNAGKFPLTLGGEHSMTAGIIKAFIKKYPDLVILHFDAHPNLKDYNKEPYFNTCVIRNIADQKVSHIVSCGIRSISTEEVRFLEEHKDIIDVYFAKDINNWDIDQIIKPLKDKKVYITFDLDGFDSSLMQATGTPEPGGMFWQDAVSIIAKTAKIAKIVGADVIELAPIRQFHSCDFLAAKLCYKIIGYAFNDKLK